MTVDIRPGTVKGRLTAPPSKSMAHRLLIGGGLAAGTSVIRGISASEDMGATLDCLKAIGATYTREGDTVTITGTDLRHLPENAQLPCRESGSTLRFFIPLCLLDGKPVTFTGSETLFSRPLSVYEDICRKQGLLFEPGTGSLTAGGVLQSGNYRVKGNISSQFISGLLFSLPLLPEDSTIQLQPPVESRSYIDLTIKALSVFGITVRWQDERTLLIPGGQTYRPADTTVEGDYSNAAFFAALGVLGSDITIDGLDPDSLQGDRVYTRHFASLTRGTPTIHIADCPDLGPILFAVAAAHSGGVFTGTRRLKIKESDRATAMAEELAKCGVAVTVHEDSVVVYPHDLHPPTEPLCGHNDHRIVMSLAVLLTKLGGRIEGAQAVTKSMPDFFTQLTALGFEVDTL
ncbi:MAG: 3-phosphoshikimate 1-carboxyvinyltransferase [Clostridia bacterium]|nr:3-phosphoshikimate 1-carboxyvinyltransferase [Clostridia bacterium]